MSPTSVNAADELLAAVVNGIDSVAGINVFKVFRVKEPRA